MSVARSFVTTEFTRDTSVESASDRERHVVQLGDAIATLAARLHAATYELLVLLREFHACAGWNNGFLSCAHWLHWRTGIDLGAAREKVRVARALAALPCISAAMQRGELSYAKVRALTRIATAANDARLVDVALEASAAQVERLVRAWRRVDQVEAARRTEHRHLHRSVTMHVDYDGMVVLRGRLTPEIGAVVQRALEAAADRLFHEVAHATAGVQISEEVTPAQRRADALRLLADSALSADLDRATAGDRYQVVPHVDAATLQLPRERGSASSTNSEAGQAVVELNDAPTTFPRKRRSASPATPRSSSCVTRPTVLSSTSAAGRGRSRPPSAVHCSRATRSANFPAAPHAVAMAITSGTGPMVARRVSTTSRCSAVAIIARCTKADSRSSDRETGRQRSTGVTAPVWRMRRSYLETLLIVVGTQPRRTSPPAARRHQRIT